MEQFVQFRAGRAAAAGRLVLDVVFPPACAFCDAPLQRARASVQLCAPCESKIPWLFGEGGDLGAVALSALVPLLSLPQTTHYALDGFIWRKRGNPDLGRLLMGGAAGLSAERAPERP